MKKLKIAFIVHDYSRCGGHSRYVAELVSRFKEKHEVHVYASVWEEPDPELIKFHYVPSLRFNSFLSVVSFIIPACFIPKSNYDIVHSQGLTGLRQDVVTAHFVQEKWIDELRKKNKKSFVSWFLWKYVVGKIEKLIFQNFFSSTVISISKSVTKDLEICYGRTKDVFLIYHGTDCKSFNPENKKKFRDKIRKNLNISSSAFVALYVGNLQKGADSVIKAIKNCPNVQFVFVTGSDMSDEKNMCKRFDIESQVTWINKSQNIHELFSIADCFVFPTVYEPFGMVVCEAMASGLPVITSRIAGAADLIDDRVSGLLLDDPSDYMTIGKFINMLSSDPSLCSRMGSEARNKIMLYNWDFCADKTEQLYLEIVAKKRGK